MTLQKRLFVAFVFFEVTVMLSSDLYSRPFMKVQVGKDQEKAQSEKDSHSKNRGGKKKKN